MDQLEICKTLLNKLHSDKVKTIKKLPSKWKKNIKIDKPKVHTKHIFDKFLYKNRKKKRSLNETYFPCNNDDD